MRRATVLRGNDREALLHVRGRPALEAKVAARPALRERLGAMQPEPERVAERNVPEAHVRRERLGAHRLAAEMAPAIDETYGELRAQIGEPLYGRLCQTMDDVLERLEPTGDGDD